VYYPIPLSKQLGYQHYPQVSRGVGVSEGLSEKVLSLPMHPYLSGTTQRQVVTALTQ
jgi:dTDP-4-amino-4,6-dideoxygalactose transaminase